MLHYSLAEPSPSFVMSHTFDLLLPRYISVKTSITKVALFTLLIHYNSCGKKWHHENNTQALYARTGRHETHVSYRDLYGAPDELRSKSGNWPHSCGAPFWGVALWLCLCCRLRLPCFSESTRPFAYSLNVLAAVMWPPRLFCFHGALLLYMSVMESFDPPLAPSDAGKASTATSIFPCCEEFVLSELVIWYLVCREC